MQIAGSSIKKMSKIQSFSVDHSAGQSNTITIRRSDVMIISYLLFTDFFLFRDLLINISIFEDIIYKTHLYLFNILLYIFTLMC